MYRSLASSRNLVVKSPIPSRTPSPSAHPVLDPSRSLHSANFTHHSGAQLNQPFGSEGFVNSLDISSDIVTDAAEKVNKSVEHAEKAHCTYPQDDGRTRQDMHHPWQYGQIEPLTKEYEEVTFKMKKD
ncbi:hypothetical protein INT44_001420 [Umbelopsis vinacea]|uniref:Uncharacterized protein n=1 Tax=Umbelopsis vinacea TaxID=44442 RepID=A0A8H7QAS9_9FUNG|nr:hypothetical protein INT44_001420 [Umbelopsis vinacea]